MNIAWWHRFRHPQGLCGGVAADFGHLSLCFVDAAGARSRMMLVAVFLASRVGWRRSKGVYCGAYDLGVGICLGSVTSLVVS